MKKNIIGIIAIAALGGLIASGCTYSKGKMPVVDVSEGIGSPSQQEPGDGSAGKIAEGEGDFIAPPSGTTGETPPSGGSVEDGGEEVNDENAAPLSVESVSGPESKTVYVVFNRPVDAAAIIENDSIQFYGTGDGLMSLKIQGELSAGKNPNVIKFTANEAFLTSLVHTVKILGADSEDASKAAVDIEHNKLQNEYVRKLLCGGSADGLLTCQAPVKTATTLSVESVSGPDAKTVYVVFNKPVDAAAIIENDSIQFYGTSDGLMSLKIQGDLMAGANPNVIKFTAKEAFTTSLLHTVKILGADSGDASKAAVDVEHNKLQNEYVRKLLCGGSADGLLTCQAL